MPECEQDSMQLHWGSWLVYVNFIASDEIIWDHVIEKSISHVGKKFLLETHLTFQKAITISCPIELTMVQVNVISQGTASTVRAVQTLLM